MSLNTVNLAYHPLILSAIKNFTPLYRIKNDYSSYWSLFTALTRVNEECCDRLKDVIRGLLTNNIYQ